MESLIKNNYKFYTAYVEGQYSPLFDSDEECKKWLKENTDFSEFGAYSYPLIYATKIGKEPEVEFDYHYQPYIIYEVDGESKMLEFDILFATLDEALEFIKPFSEEYIQSRIGVTAVAIDDFFSAY